LGQLKIVSHRWKRGKEHNPLIVPIDELDRHHETWDAHEIVGLYQGVAENWQINQIIISLSRSRCCNAEIM